MHLFGGGGEDASDIIRYAINSAAELANLGGAFQRLYTARQDRLSDLLDQLISKLPIQSAAAS